MWNEPPHCGHQLKSAALTALLTGIALATTAALVVVVAVQPLTPQIARSAAPAEAVGVTSEQFLDPHSVALDVTYGTPATLTSPLAGRVTSLDCTSGSTVTSGSAPLSVNGEAVLALAMDVPPWRDLPRGTTGTDVDALHTALTKLGYDVSEDGATAGTATAAALREALGKVGAPHFTGSTLPLSKIMWLPTSELTIDACDVVVGDGIGQGQQVARGATPLIDVQVVAMPSPLAPGDHVLVTGGATVAVDADGVVSDPGSLEGLLESTSSDAPPTGTLQLAEPITVSGIPASAITTTDGTTGCVIADGSPTPVTLVGSQLGTTYVTFEGTAPTSVALTAPEQGCQ